MIGTMPEDGPREIRCPMCGCTWVATFEDWGEEVCPECTWIYRLNDIGDMPNEIP